MKWGVLNKIALLKRYKVLQNYTRYNLSTIPAILHKSSNSLIIKRLTIFLLSFNVILMQLKYVYSRGDYMDKLSKQIEEEREKLDKLIEENTDKDVILKKSQELDILINEFYKKRGSL